jgi:electron transfer flavoprotein-quinone oxidoreductase
VVASRIDGRTAGAGSDLLDAFKQRPEVARLIKGGQTSEYSAHVNPEGGLNSMGKLFGEGILIAGDAAGFSMNIGVTVRGMEYAMATGYYAAQAAIKAKEADNYSAAAWPFIEKLLNDSFVMKDFQSFKDAPHALDNPVSSIVIRNWPVTSCAISMRCPMVQRPGSTRQ